MPPAAAPTRASLATKRTSDSAGPAPSNLNFCCPEEQLRALHGPFRLDWSSCRRYWASCRESCSPGINPADPPEHQTPWSCHGGPVLAARSGLSWKSLLCRRGFSLLREGPVTCLALGDVGCLGWALGKYLVASHQASAWQCPC